MTCENMKANLKYCNCTGGSCERKGRCCECLHYHRKLNQMPACFFSKEQEATYDRSVENFVRKYK